MVMGKMKMKMKVKDEDEYYYFYQHVDFSNQQFMKAMPRPAWRLDRDRGQANAPTSLIWPRYRVTDAATAPIAPQASAVTT